jgi:hypothetical protein
MSANRQDSGGERPYSKLTIGQLEGMFANRRMDSAFLRTIDRELGFRETDRDRRLRVRVGKSLAAMPNAKTASSVRPSVAKPALPQRPPLPSRLSHVPSVDTVDTPEAILSAWTAMEALSPQTYRKPEDMAAGDKSCVAELGAGVLPWETGETSRKNYRLYYLVVLGAIPMAKAAERLAAAFGEDEEGGSRLRDKAAIAAVLLDRNGVVVEENGVSVSSFAWALPRALKLDFEALGGWLEAEPNIVAHLDGMLRRHGKEGEPLPVDKNCIERAQRWLTQELSLEKELVEKPRFAVRVYQHHKAKHLPEAALLNSFFLSDLTRARTLIKEGDAPIGLRRYLGLDAPRETIDLLTDRNALEEAVAPAAMPLARWPHPGGHSLVLLQQAAVNLARSELADGEGLIAVNGPPGTGKTTLLRDLVAAAVFDRALAMAVFDDPEQAFITSGESVSVGDKAAFRLYRLAPSLKGHEIVVASSNNRAVENISRELPAASAIDRAKDFGYFQSIGALLQNGANAEAGSARTDPAGCWGMIAAALGNRRNLAAFQQAFWWDEERSFRLYLKAAKGDDVARDVRDPDSGALLERQPPAIVQAEHPSLPENARAAWREARGRFLALKRDVETDIEALEHIRELSRALDTCRTELAQAAIGVDALGGRRNEAEARAARATAKVESIAAEHRTRTDDAARSRRDKPFFIHRIFRTVRWTAWTKAHAPLAAAATEAAARLHEASHIRDQRIAVFDRLSRECRDAGQRRASLIEREGLLAANLDQHRPALGARIVDDALFAQGHEHAHKASPWMPDSLQRKREDLFQAALDVHRAFIDVAARRVYHNLGALMDTFSNGPPKDDARRALMGDLWSTLHLAVPVVSTTFASANRMLGALPAKSIGWLLVDEGGQAHPQAAVGAIMRARRTVVVGDPLQIKPVVALPERLSAALCRRFAIDGALWSAPEASAQTVADRAPRFQATFRSAGGMRRVGIPLVVHRRSLEPMFGMFNRIAYDGQMVQGALPRSPGPIGNALGQSHWIDVAGAAATKWCPAEGEAVIGLLKTMAASGVKEPDLFIVTPFRIVAQELRRRLEKEHELFESMDVDARSWVNERVGTIHTVQGREADAVVLVLGAPNQTHSRARSWAAETPNVFNVALSRARESFYVIGSREAWSDTGHGAEIAKLPFEPQATMLEGSPAKPQPRPANTPWKVGRVEHRRGPNL